MEDTEMAKKVAKIKKPKAEKFKKGRKLFFLPLVFTPENPEGEFKEMLDRYWRESRQQLEGLEIKLSKVQKIFHEWVDEGGLSGIETMDAMASGSRDIVKDYAEKDVELVPVEDRSLLNEFIDWNRCLMMGLMSRKVFGLIYRSYEGARKKRHNLILKKVDESLGDDEVGLLIMNEENKVQFPKDMQVFYIAPPSLDEIRRYIAEKNKPPEKDNVESMIIDDEEEGQAS
jgi:hypothetical protein